ncbi:MAG TPA: right-handed parallel beta-helix repeat-containing protein [Tahibacter sp.]|nr:right-handed parallel beta-helix repeat-containing protein [Tahibacter sp.]
MNLYTNRRRSAAVVFRRCLVAVVAAGCVAEPALAARFCVADATGFGAAVAAAQGNNDHNEILLRQGVYVTPTGGWNLELGDRPHNLDIVGGYTDAGCTQRHADASLTVLDGANVARPLTIDTGGSVPGNGAHIRISGLTFRNGRGDFVGGLKVSDPGPIYGGTILIEGNIFRDNVAISGIFDTGPGGLLAATDGPDFSGGTGLIVRNNVFVGNSGPNASAMFLFSNNQIEVANNTIVGNRCTGADLVERWSIRTYTFTGLHFSNNVFWGNNPAGLPDTYDLRLYAQNTNQTTLTNNLIQARIGTALAETGSLSTNPGFVDAGNGDYRPDASSPLADAGSDATAAGLMPTDVAGNARVTGARVDIGAYERAAAPADPIFTGGFEAVD